MHNFINYKEYYGRISFSPVKNEYVSGVYKKDGSNAVQVQGKTADEVKVSFKNYIDKLIKEQGNK